MPNPLLNVIEPAPAIAPAGFVRPAQIIERLPDGGFAVAMEQDGRTHRLRAQSALPAATRIGTGTRVLVTGETLEHCYVIGVLGPRIAAAVAGEGAGAGAGEGVATRSGALARVVERDGADRIEVCDTKGRVVFQYDPESGGGVLSAPEGDLKLQAPNGNIDLVSGKRVRCQGETVDLVALDAETQRPARLGLRRGTAKLSSPVVKLAAGHAEVAVRESHYHGELLTVTVKQAKQVFGKLETVATRILERATDVYRHVENLQQLKAGRMRTLVKGACHIKGGRTTIKAEDDVKIAGRRVHLG